MSGTTSIDDLPTNSEGNITLETSSPPVQQVNNSPQKNDNITLSSSDINKIVEGIQMASASNMTTLPSRDIPQNTSAITNDPAVQPNHVPEKKGGFVEDFETQQARLYQEKIQQKQNEEKLDTLYDKLQIPIMISLIYFIYQLPFVNKTLLTYIPSLFIKEKQLSVGGYIFKAGLFGITFLLIQNIIEKLGTI